jgi:hypothetical protein
MSDQPVLNPFAPDSGAPAPEPFITETARLLAGLSYVSQVLVPGVAGHPVVGGGRAAQRFSALPRYAQPGSIGVCCALLHRRHYGLYRSGLGSGFAALCTVALFLPPVAVLAYYGYQAFRGRREAIPWLTDLLRRYGWLY